MPWNVVQSFGSLLTLIGLLLFFFSFGYSFLEPNKYVERKKKENEKKKK